MRKTSLRYALLIFLSLVMVAGFSSCKSDPILILSPPQQVSDPTADLIGQWDVYADLYGTGVESDTQHFIDIQYTYPGYYVIGAVTIDGSGLIKCKVKSDRYEEDGWYIVSLPAGTIDEIPFDLTIKYRSKEGDLNTIKGVLSGSDIEMTLTLERRSEPISVDDFIFI